MSNNLEIEKFYKNKFGEEVQYLSNKAKTSIDIKDIDILKEEEEKDGYIIIHPKRNCSLFEQKCKYCKSTPIKKEDKEYYLKYSCCKSCYIINEEDRPQKRI